MKKYLIPEMEVEFFDGRDLFSSYSGEGPGKGCDPEVVECFEHGGWDPGFGGCPPDFGPGIESVSPSCPGVSFGS